PSIPGHTACTISTRNRAPSNSQDRPATRPAFCFQENVMKKILLAALLLAPLPVLAQPAPPQQLFTAGADIPGLIAKAKAAQKSPAVNSVQPVAVDGPYRVLLEYRTGLTPPTVHHGQAELVTVVQGNARLVM